MEYVLVIFLVCTALLLHTYIVYPSFAALIGGANDDCTELNQLPGVSVLVPAYNEADVIQDKIDNFLAIDYPTEKIEMLIVDDGSSDGTRAIIESNPNPRIHLLPPAPRSGKAAGLNRMVEQASHSYLLLCDANVMFANDAVRRLAESISLPNVGAVTGEVKLIGSTEEFETGESLYYVLERRIQRAESKIGSVMGVDGGMYLLRSDLYETLPADTILDDFITSMNIIRKGYRIAYDCRARASESGTPTTKQEFSRRIRMMAGVVQLLKRRKLPLLNQPVIWFQFVSHKALRWATPLLLLTILACSAILSSEYMLFHYVWFIQLTTYTFFLILAAFPQLRRNKFSATVFYFFMSQTAMLIGLFKGLFNRQKSVWEKGKRLRAAKSD